ncbi:hypothetical protein ADUPG1_004308, partial [Aduncisulcus paluster]
LESNSNIQCVNEDNDTLEVVSDCVEDWYGDSCNDECPLHNGQQCGGSDFGTCDSTTHTCSCLTGFEGDACEFYDYDSLETFICAQIDAASDLVTLVSGTSLTCIDGEISVDELCNIYGLDLSTSGLTSIEGLSYATNLAELHLDTL